MAKELQTMKTLSEIEAICNRILGLLEHPDLRSSNMFALTNMLGGIRDDLERHLADRRADGDDSSELQAAEDALGTMNNHALWLREYVGVRPVVEVSQKVRMATLRALRVVSLLHDVMTATGSGSRSPVASRRSTTAQFAVRP
jgi:hypothetical protein